MLKENLKQLFQFNYFSLTKFHILRAHKCSSFSKQEENILYDISKKQTPKRFDISKKINDMSTRNKVNVVEHRDV